MACAEGSEGWWFGVGVPEEVCVDFPVYGAVIDVTTTAEAAGDVGDWLIVEGVVTHFVVGLAVSC